MSTKISQLTSATDVTANDLIQIVDVEDGVMAPSGTNKKATASLLAKELAKQPLEPGVVISGSSSGDAVRITQTGSGNALVVEDSANPDASPFAVSSDGLVGVGTNSPQGKLDIRDGTLRLSTDNNKTAVYGINRGDTSSVQGMASIAMFGSGTNGFLGNITFRTAESDTFDAMPSERMRISSDGNVGIGTSSPTAKLNVVGDTSNDAVRITQTGSGNALVVEDSTNPDATPFVVAASGNVGIGISNPIYGLSVGTSASLGPFVFTGNNVSTGDCGVEIGSLRTGSGPAYVDFHSVSGGDHNSRIIRYSGVDGNLDINNNGLGSTRIFTDNAERMRITSAGNVGIGTNSPNASCLLDLSSTTRGFRPPSMTTTERNAIAMPIAGLMIYNNTTNKLNFYNGSAWEAVTSSV